jgi:hypothetical protein
MNVCYGVEFFHRPEYNRDKRVKYGREQSGGEQNRGGKCILIQRTPLIVSMTVVDTVE